MISWLSSVHAGCVAALALSAPAQAKDVILYEGYVTAENVEAFTGFIGEHIDEVIGLRLSVDRAEDEDENFSTDFEDDQLIITSVSPFDTPTEVLVNEGVGKSAAGLIYTIDGFYLVKSGGSHAAGAVSIGLLPVDEAIIRLNSDLNVIVREAPL